MGAESEITSKTFYKEIKDADRLSVVLSFTVPSVELYEVLGQSGKFLSAPIERSAWLPLLAEVSRTAQDTQNILGITTRLYPEGQIVNGVYMYDTPPPGSKVEKRKYKPRPIGPPSQSTRVLFPNSEWLLDITEKMAPALTADNGARVNPKLGSPETLAEIIYGFFRYKEQPNARIYAEMQLGYPIIFCDDRSDLLAFSPHEKISLPLDVQGFSFVTTGLRRAMPSGKIEGTPLVVCLSSCPRPIARQLLVSQLLWRRAVNDARLSPILISKNSALVRTKELSEEAENLLFESELDRKVKDKALALLIREPRPIGRDWRESTEIQRVINNLGREFWISNIDGVIDLNMENWLTDRDVIDPRINRMKEIEAKFKKKLKEALEFLSEWPYALPSREDQLIVANYLSHFPLNQWKEARESFISWPDRLKFLSSLGIPRTPRV